MENVLEPIYNKEGIKTLSICDFCLEPIVFCLSSQKNMLNCILLHELVLSFSLDKFINNQEFDLYGKEYARFTSFTID